MSKPPYTPPAHFVAWLEADKGRAAYFHRVDNRLFPPLISKFKKGEVAITFEYAVRLERAQKPSDNPLKAEDLMTFLEDRQLHRYVTGLDPRPPLVEVVRKQRISARKLMTVAEAYVAGDRMPWFKWWDGTAADMKFRMVAEDVKLPVACIVGAWAYVLEHASRSVDRGSIADIDYELMAYTLQIPDPETVCNAMKRRKLLDETGTITKWEDRQGKRERNEAPGSSTERVQRMRAKRKAEEEAKKNKGLQPGWPTGGDDGQGGNGETHVTPGNATKRPKKKNREEGDKKPKTLTPSSADAAGEGGEDDPGEPEPAKVKPFDQFWDAYPRRVAKAEAQKAWTKLKIDNDAPLLAIILNAIEKQKDGHNWRNDYIPNPATWLRAGRWLDEVRPYVAAAPKLPPGWWETPEGIKAAGLMMDPPIIPRPGEGQKAVALRIRVALGEVDMPTDQARDYTAAPIPEKIERPYIPPAPPEGVVLTDDQRQARRDELREAMKAMNEKAGLARAGVAAANGADEAA